ncbi:hypothetical protein [Hahella ganghwensis]|uniref:hypothetical protein n=1 Tax=Hahella ganghwensis TaxID=286420 RepID=UPI0003763BFB|nr:hypothetical protein [Hahella ganghwensis]
MTKEIKDPTANQRKKNERIRMKDLGFTRRDVWAHPDDWPDIRALEKKLKNKRLQDD